MKSTPAHAFAGRCRPSSSFIKAARPKGRSPGLTLRLSKWAKIVPVTPITAAGGIGVEVVAVIAAPFLRRSIDGLSHADSAAAAADLLQYRMSIAAHGARLMTAFLKLKNDELRGAVADLAQALARAG
jgi:hypothetical protein